MTKTWNRLSNFLESTKEEIEKALDASGYTGDAEERTLMVLERAKNRKNG